MKAEEHRDASGRFCISVKLEANQYDWICRTIIKRFSLSRIGDALAGTGGAVDVVSRMYSLGTQQVLIEWDNWIGFGATAMNQESEELVRQIAVFIESLPETGGSV